MSKSKSSRSKTVDQVARDPRARQWMLVLPWSDPRVQAVLSALAAFGSEVLWAWIRHDKDPGISVHVHIVLRFKNPKSRSFIARHLGVATSSVRKLTGQKGWERYLRYLTHSDPEPGIPSGEHLYGDDEVFANFDWKNAVLEAELPKKRAPKADAAALAILTGELTVEDVRVQYPGMYAKRGNATRFRAMEKEFEEQKFLDEERRSIANDVRDAQIEVAIDEMWDEIRNINRDEPEETVRGFVREHYWSVGNRKTMTEEIERKVVEDMRRDGWPVDPV